MKRAIALLLAAVAAPCVAQDFRCTEASVLYYINVPLGAQSRAQRDPSLGFAFQGRRAEQVIRMELPVMKLVGGGVIEAKYLLVGAAAAGVAAIAGGSDKSAETQRAQQAAAAESIAANGEQCLRTGAPSCLAFKSRRYHFVRF